MVETLDANGNPVSTVGEYEYDGDGKRVKKHVPSTGEVTVFVYDAGGKLIGEYSTVAAPQSPKVSYTTADHLGSPRILTDENGATISRRDFMPYGEEIARQNYGADSILQKFTTYERDNESSLDFAQARYYGYVLGRFTSSDSFGGIRRNPQSLNRYSYVLMNPLKYHDPTGHVWENPYEKSVGESDWHEMPQYEFLRFREWVNQGGRPVWVNPEDYGKDPGSYTLWTEMTYNSTEGQVTLDPRGPNPETPWGWTLDNVAVGDPNEPALQPSPPGENGAESTATDTPPMIMSSVGDPRRSWYLIYLDVHSRRSRAQALFPDSRGLDAERHRWATRQTALRWGSGTARTLGVLNEGQGFIMHDVPFLLRNCFMAIACNRGTWAFQWSDLQHNERGIDEARTMMNQPKNNTPR